MIIAVDGPTASGKGTIARALAAYYRLPHLDTGLLYRAVGHRVAAQGGDPDDPGDALAGTRFDDALIDDPGLRDEGTGALASRVSIHPAVRAALMNRQLAFADRPGGAVLDGRDIGTVVAPHADVKLYVTASAEARADRRWREMRERGSDATLAEVLEMIERRDARDRGRADAPLTVAKDAVMIDTTELDREAAVAEAIAAVEAYIEKRR